MSVDFVLQSMKNEKLDHRRFPYGVLYAPTHTSIDIQLVRTRKLSPRILIPIHVTLEQLGFQNVRVDHERIHKIYLVRANVGTTNCVDVRSAKILLRRAAQQIGKRLVRRVLHPLVEGRRIRAALLFTDSEGLCVDLDPAYARGAN